MEGEQNTFFPLASSQINPGLLVVRLPKAFQGVQKVFWETFLTQIANALEREFLSELTQKARFLDGPDRLYKTLFSSISHELRIPVATVMGASGALLNSPRRLHYKTFQKRRVAGKDTGCQQKERRQS
mgnify:CR=1 FL=1